MGSKVKMMIPWKQTFLPVAVILLLLYVRPNTGLEIEHPHSFSVFKRGVVLGDVSYSYASTDMGSPENGRYKTVTVIKNIAVPKPTSMMFSDRSEHHFFDKIDTKSSVGSSGGGHHHGPKKRTHVEYWPPRADNQVTQHKHSGGSRKAEPELKSSFKSGGAGGAGSGGSAQHQRPQADYHRSRQQVVVVSKSTHTPPAPAATMEQLQEEPKHPVELLELAKSAIETLNQKAKIGGSNTGPVTFPADAMAKKKVNGIVSVAKEYTSVLTTDPKDRSQQPIASKLRTKVDLSAMSKPLSGSSLSSSSASSSSSEEIPLKELEQSEYVFNHRTGSFEFKVASKAPKAVQEYLRGSGGPYGGYKMELPMMMPPQPSPSPSESVSSEDSGPSTYSSPKELLFAELQNAVTTRNVSMIKSLASQLEETFNIGKLDFESLKMGDYGRKSTEETPTMDMTMTTMSEQRMPFDFGYGAETTTIMDYPAPEVASEAPVPSTTIKAPSTSTPPMTTTKKPLRYIAPKLRGFKRFSSKRQTN